MSQRKLIFITGASRSGTTLLSLMLRNHRDVFGLKELQYFGDAWDPRDARRRFTRAEAIAAAATMLACQEHGVLAHATGTEHRRQAARLVDALGSSGTDPVELFAGIAHRAAQAGGKKIPCEQTPRYIFYARELLEVYPAAEVVHIVRDPRAVMASQKMRWQRRRMAADGRRLPRYEALRVWVNYHPFTVARLWTRATVAALALADHPRVTILRFEDLVSRPETTLRGLCERLGLEYDERLLDVPQVNSSHLYSTGGRRGLRTDAIDKWREVLSPTEISITESYCGALMRRFDYARESGAGRIGAWRRVGYLLSYLAHLGGVVLVNPTRAYVQGRALMRPRAVPGREPVQGNPAK